MVYHQDLKRVEKSIADQIEGNPRNFDYVEYSMIAKDGSVKWIEVFYVFITDKMKESLKEKKEMMSRSVEILRRPLNDILPRTELYWRKC